MKPSFLFLAFLFLIHHQQLLGQVKLFEDKTDLLNASEQATIEKALKNAAHPIYIRILPGDDSETSKIETSLNKLKQENSDELFTLIHILVSSYSDNKKYFEHTIKLDWKGLERELSNAEDHYSGRSGKKNLVAFKLELKILFHYFNDDQYAKGLKKAIELIGQLQNKEIDSLAVSPPFMDTLMGTLFFWALILILGIFGTAYLFVKIKKKNK